jgi:PST family polysaccharide transporter
MSIEMDEMEDLRGQAMRGVSWSFVKQWGEQAVALLVLFVLARLLEPADFGLFAIANVFVLIVNTLMDQGFGAAVVQRADLEDGHLDTAFWTNVLLGISLAIVMLFGARFVSVVFSQPELDVVIRWLALIVIIGSLRTTATAVLRRNLMFGRLAMFSIVSALAGGFVGIVLALLGFGVWSLVGQQVSRALAGLIMVWLLVDWRPGINVSRRHFRDLWQFGIHVTAANLVQSVNRRLDVLLIGFFLGTQSVGLYSVGRRIVEGLIMGFSQAVGQVALPTFSKMQDDKERMADAFLSVVQMMSVVSFPVFALLAVLAPNLIPTVLGEQWLSGAPVLTALAICGIIASILWFNSTLMLANGKSSWRLGWTVANTVGNVVAFFMSFGWGIVAVAIGFAARAYLFAPLGFILVRRLIPLTASSYILSMVPSMGAAGLAVGAVIGIEALIDNNLSQLAMLLTGAVVGLIVYAAALFAFAPNLIRRARFLSRLALGRQV